MDILEKIKEFPFVLAPLAGYTDYPLRAICKEYGAALTYTEMVNVYSMASRTPKIKELIFFDKTEHPVALQLFGNNPEKFYASTAIAVEMGFDLIDINFGCPVPKVTRASGGSSLMTKPLLAAQIMEAVVKGAQGTPVSIKIRSGWDDASLNYLEFNKMAQDTGITIITLHPRTRAQMFRGTANWEHIKILKENSKLFVIGNGDVTDSATALKMKEVTGCDAVMIGRAAMGNPFIFKTLRDKEFIPDLKEQVRAAIKHYDMLVAFKGQKGVYEMRKYFSRYIKGFGDAGNIRKEIVIMEDPELVKQKLRQLIADIVEV